MNREMKRSKSIKVAGVAVALTMLVLVGGPVRAGCSDGGGTQTKERATGRFIPAVYQTGSETATFKTVGDDWGERSAIVGLWKFEARLKGAQNGLPDGFLFDWGLATWHDDGTEIQFTGARPPSAGDVCMGVWRQVGRSSFKLNHIALGLTPPTASGTYVGLADIRYNVKVDASGNGYSGTFTLTQYAGNPDDGTEFDESSVLAVFTGTVTAVRVTVD